MRQASAVACISKGLKKGVELYVRGTTRRGSIDIVDLASWKTLGLHRLVDVSWLAMDWVL